MKSTILPIAIFCLTSILSSCSEDYTCVCRDPQTNEELFRTTVSARNANDANEECDDQESAWVSDRCLIE